MVTSKPRAQAQPILCAAKCLALRCAHQGGYGVVRLAFLQCPFSDQWNNEGGQFSQAARAAEQFWSRHVHALNDYLQSSMQTSVKELL